MAHILSDPYAGAQEFRLRANHAVIPLWGIFVRSSTDYQTTIPLTGFHDHDTASEAIEQALVGLRFERIDDTIIHGLLHQNDTRLESNHVPDAQIIFACDRHHKKAEFELY